jgi:hypothetical protein
MSKPERSQRKDLYQRQSGPCKVKGCVIPAIKKGFCNAHYLQHRRKLKLARESLG